MADINSTAIVDEYGNPMVVLHGTEEIFSRFNDSFLGRNTDMNASDESFAQTAHIGFWFNVGGNLDTAYSNQMRCCLAIENPFSVDSLEDLALMAGMEGGAELRERLIGEGYDGIIVECDSEFGGTSFIAFSSDQIIIL